MFLAYRCFVIGDFSIPRKLRLPTEAKSSSLPCERYADPGEYGLESNTCNWDGRYLGMDVSENSGTPKSSILIGFSIIFTIHFGVPLFLETPVCRTQIIDLGGFYFDPEFWGR